MNLYDVVTKLVGPVHAVGDSGIDAKRLENLRTLTTLLDSLLADVMLASGDAGRPEASMKAIGEHARKWLKELAE